MTRLKATLGPFRSRVRWMRAWRGAAVGSALSAIAAASWAGLDWAGVVYTSWGSMGCLLICGALLGFLMGALSKISDRDLVLSIDRRAGLKDRLGTALERESGDQEFDEPLRADASSKATELDPKEIFPMRISGWHFTALAAVVIASAVFLLGNTPILLSPQDRAERAELQKAGESVERVAKPLTEPENGQETPENVRLANDLERFAKELQKARLNKEQALQKANDLAKKAEELAKQSAQELDKSLVTAEAALEKIKKQELEKSGFDGERAGDRMNAADQAKAQQLQKEMDRMQQQLNSKDSLGASERSQLEKQLSDTRKQLQDLQLSKEAQDALKKLFDDPEMKKLMEMMREMQNAAKDAKGSGQMRLSPEQIKELQKKLEELAKQLKDPEKMREFIKQIKEALKNAKACSQCSGLGLSLMACMGLGGNGGLGRDDLYKNTGFVNKTNAEKPGQGKTNLRTISGSRDEERGDETYIEVKGPTGLGAKSSVPYTSLLPQYRKRVESALNRNQIPKQHEKRVREYFNSLGGQK